MLTSAPACRRTQFISSDFHTNTFMKRWDIWVWSRNRCYSSLTSSQICISGWGKHNDLWLAQSKTISCSFSSHSNKRRSGINISLGSHSNKLTSLRVLSTMTRNQYIHLTCWLQATSLLFPSLHPNTVVAGTGGRKSKTKKEKIGNEEGQWQVDGYHNTRALSPSRPPSKPHENLLDEVSFKCGMPEQWKIKWVIVNRLL